jgi:hypothetical protein
MNVAGSLPPLVAFMDERLERSASLTRIITGCCVFGRKRWMAFHQKAASVCAIRHRRRLAAFEEFLITMDGIVVLGYADIPSDLYRQSQIDGTDDIPRMSRTDNLWSQVFLSVVASALAFLQRPGCTLELIDLYFDRKDLKAAHRAQFENVLRKTLSEISIQAAVELPKVFGPSPHEFRFGAIEGIDKPERGSAFNAFQQGTELAHHLCSQATEIIRQGSAGRMLVGNHTDVVRSIIVKFVPSSDDDAETPTAQAVT